jgi:proton-dependent oligopeptide transporter, POT family
MKHAFFGLIDAACMNNADAIAVLFFGYVIGSKLYPFLADRGLRIPTSYKFAMGSLLGALAIGWALMVEGMIHASFQATGEPVSILWQAPSYILIGAGEIWAVSAAYEAVFNASAPDKKVQASAINLFFNGAVPNFICIFLYNVCAPWFRNSHGTTNITHLRDYATANIANYFWVLFIISMGGVIANVLPMTRQFIQNVEEKASESIKTPKTPHRPPTAERRRAASAAARLGEEETSESDEEEEEDEEAQLLRMHRHQLYLKYGSGPVLHKAGSMRAGAAIYSKNKKEASKVRRKQIEKLYKSEFSLLPSSAAGSPAQLVPRDGGAGVIGGGGTGVPILAPGTFLMPRQQQPQQQKPPTGRPLEKQSSM